MIYHREVLEAVNGFDEDLDYGEDFDVKHRIEKEGFEKEESDLSVPEKFPDSLGELWRQGFWYGKSFLTFFQKYPQKLPSLFLTFFLGFLPISVLLSPFSIIFGVLAFFQLSFCIYLGLEYYRQSASIYGFFVPLLKVLRSFFIILGIIAGFVSRDKGKS